MKKIVLLVIFCLFGVLQLQAQIWEECNNGLIKSTTTTTYHDFNSLAIVDNYLFALTESGIFRSSDVGNTWFEKNNGISGNPFFIGYNQSIIYIITPQGIFTSDDLGETWVLKNQGITGSVNSLFFQGSVTYALTNTDLYLSNNSGNNWAKKTLNLIGTVKFIKNNGSDLWAVSEKGVYLSINSGDSWIQKNNNLTDMNINDIAFLGDNLYLGTSYVGVCFSSDKGGFWTEKYKGLPDKPIKTLKIISNTLYAVYDNELYATNDNGTTWSAKNNGLTGSISLLTNTGNNLYILAGGNIFLSTNKGDNWVIKNNNISTTLTNIIINNNSIYALSKKSVYLSTNMADNWTEKKNGKTEIVITENHDVENIQVLGDKVFIWADSSYKRFYNSSNNGDNWEKITDNWANDIKDFPVFYKNGTELYASTISGIYLSNNSGASWAKINNNSGNLEFYNNNIIIINGGLSISSDKGVSWVTKSVPGANINNLTFSGDNIYAITNKGVYLSNDNFETWILRNNGLTNYVFTLICDGQNIYALTSYGFFISKNEGRSWVRSTNTNLPNYVKIYNIQLNNIYAATTSGIFLSTNYGVDWIAKDNGITDKNIGMLYIKDNNMFAFADYSSYYPWGYRKIFISTNGGNNWELKNSGITAKTIRCINSNDNYYFVGTNSGVFRTTLSNLLKTKPTISNIADIIIEENSTGEASFIIDGTNPNTLQLTKEATDIQLLPLDNLVFSGTGNNRKLTITPAKNNYGIANITIKVSDGTDIASTTFKVTVDHIKMTITQIEDIEINEDSVATVPFLVNAADITKLKFVKESTNSDLLPIDSLEITGTGTNRNLIISPKKQSIGTSYITIRITDSSETVGTIFRVKVIELKPTITQIPDIIMSQNTSKDVQFSINGQNPANLTFIKETDDDKLIPIDNMIITGSGKDYNLKITPIQNKTGSCYLTVYVTNNADTASTMFQVTVQKGGYVKNDLLNTSEILISPNPVKSNFSVISETLIIQEIQVFDVLGSLILKTENSQNIDVSNLPAGVYFCLLKSGSNYYTKKFEIVR
ncbi:MAG: T9SS type A sorting domain-containing protein [bacterium]